MNKVTIDFETRSLVDLRTVTSDRYAEHPSTEILCAAVETGGNVRWWAPEWVSRVVSDYGDAALSGTQISTPELKGLTEGAQMSAFNAPFEMALWRHIMSKRHGFAPAPVENWRCDMAKALMHGLPQGLDGATSALGLPVRKDKAGHALMLKMCKPLPPLQSQYKALAEKMEAPLGEVKAQYKSEILRARNYSGPQDRHLVRWHETPEDIIRLIKYCIQDVLAEAELSKRLKPLPASEQKLWELDQTINLRGVPVDLESCRAMVEFTEADQRETVKEFVASTGGAVSTPKQYKAFAEWITSQGTECTSVSKDAVKELLARTDISENVRAALLLMQKSNKSSVAKFQAFLRGTSEDGRIRGLFVYHKAATGRWASRMVQLQNLPQGDFEDVEECISCVLKGDFTLVASFWGDPMSVASTCIRGMIRSSKGKDFICADFNAIEGRVLAWLAGEESVLEGYRQGKDPYCAVASECFGVPYEDIFEGHRNGVPEMTELRKKGKVGGLACGFGGSQGAVARFAPDMPKQDRIDLVNRWRESHPMTKSLWYALADAAADAVQNPMKAFPVGKVAYLYNPAYGFLMCKLPSGRKLFYAFPECVSTVIGPGEEAKKALVTPGVKFQFADMTIWADDDNQIHVKRDEMGETVYPSASIGESPLWRKQARVVTAWTVDSVTNKWVKRELNSLILSENITQATARDLLAHALPNLEAAGYPIILHVHDEAMAEVDEGFGSVEEFENLMCDLPDWADGLPVKASGWRGKRFKK